MLSTSKEPPSPANPDPVTTIICQLYSRLVDLDQLFASHPEANSILTTRNLAVRNTHRGKGIASRLLDLCFQVHCYST